MRRTVLLLLSGLSFAGGLPVTAFPETVAMASPSQRDPYGEYIAEAARRFYLPAAWIGAILAAESHGDPSATSAKGAMGLMQIMPETWAELRARYRLGDDPYDPHDNIVAGAAYIRILFDRYGSPGWIAAYNAGPRRYEASLEGRPLPAETRAYVATVAPSLDGNGTAYSLATAIADRPAWTQAPLFIAQPDRGPAVDPVSANRSSNGASAASKVRDVSAIVPQPGSLFAVHATEGTVP